MKVSVRQHGSATILDIEGEITFESTPGLRPQVLGALKQQGAVLVNLAAVAYVDSSGIAMLVEGLKEARSRNVSFGLFGLTKHTRAVLELVRLDKVFRIFDSEDDAVRELAPSA